MKILTIIIFILGIFIIYGIEHIWEKNICKKVDKEIKLRQEDERLAKWYYEMTTDRNDGWTRNHYKFLYENRLKELKKK